MKNIRLGIRLTEYEARHLEEEAIRRGMSKSELVRSLIGRLPDPSNKKGAFKRLLAFIRHLKVGGFQLRP
jgi:hypothetical protein